MILSRYAEISKTRKSKALVANDLAQPNFTAPAPCSPASERGGAERRQLEIENLLQAIDARGNWRGKKELPNHYLYAW